MRKLLFESLFRRPFTEQAPSPDDAAVTELAAAVGRAARRRLGRSLSIREVDAGSCNGCELEIHALEQCLLRCRTLRPPVCCLTAPCRCVDGDRSCDQEHARSAGAHLSCRPNPKWVVAVGDCARDGGCFAGSYAVVGGVSEVVPVDLHIPGCPPPPTRMLQGLLALLDKGRRRHFPLRIWGRLRLFQAGLIAGCIQAAIVLVITPLVILFAQYRDDDSSASGRDPASSVISLLPLIYVMFAAGVALTKHRYVTLTTTRIRHASQLCVIFRA